MNKEDSRRLAQLERQLRRDDPEFCRRMEAFRLPRRRINPTLAVGAGLVWAGSLVLGVLGWWAGAALALACSTALLTLMVRAKPKRRASGWDRRR